MKATFIGDPKSPGEQRSSTDLFGVVFPLNQPVDVSHLPDGQKKKLAGNRHFSVDSGEPDKKGKK